MPTIESLRRSANALDSEGYGAHGDTVRWAADAIEALTSQVAQMDDRNEIERLRKRLHYAQKSSDDWQKKAAQAEAETDAARRRIAELETLLATTLAERKVTR
jgi:predicted  nucleic acid-binding Zn-ribbon protein